MLRVDSMDDLCRIVEQMTYPQKLDPEWDGSCPCFAVDIQIGDKSVAVHGRCWRSSRCSDWQDLYLGGDLPDRSIRQVGKSFKRALGAQRWYNPYHVHIGGPDD